MKGRGKEGGRKDRRVQTRRWSKRSSTSLKNAGGGGGVGWGDGGGGNTGGEWVGGGGDCVEICVEIYIAVQRS